MNLNEIKKFMDSFHDIDNNAILYKDKNKYEIIVVTKNNNISNIIIKEKEDDSKNMIYTFDKIGENFWNKAS